MSEHLDAVRRDPAAFDPTRLALEPDPYPVLRAARGHARVLRARDGISCILGYDAADTAMRDRRFASAPIGMRYQTMLPAGAARDELMHRINFLDPPAHTRVRRILAKVFTPARIALLRPWVEREAKRLLDAAGDDEVELRAALAHPLPSFVISEMLGVPDADRDTLTQWTEEVTPLLAIVISDDDKARALAASAKFAAYVKDLVEQRRRQPDDSLLSALVEAYDAGDRLSEPELVSLVVTLYSAGHRTTRDLFINGLDALLADPAQYAAVARGETSLELAAQELLRFTTPTLFVARVPTEPIELAGTVLPAWNPTLIFLAAANRDPDQFDRPDELDVTRTGPAPLSFASGPHVCLGAALARMETEVMLATVTGRWPDLQRAGTAPSWWTKGPFRGLTHLTVRGSR